MENLADIDRFTEVTPARCREHHVIPGEWAGQRKEKQQVFVEVKKSI